MWTPISKKTGRTCPVPEDKARFQVFVRLEEAKHGELRSLRPGTLARDRAVDQILGP